MASRKRTSGSKAVVRDLTVEILKDIRDQARATNEQLEVHGKALVELRDQARATNEQLEVHGKALVELRDQARATNERLEVHGKALVKLIGEVHSLNDRFDNFLTGAHGKEHDELRARVERIEKQLERTG